MAAPSFHKQLVLNLWMLAFFHGESLAALKYRLGEDRHEGIDDDGQTKFFHEITRGLLNPNKIEEKDLRRYDLNIVGYWNAITERRNLQEDTVLNMKYFQYLSLLFTEIYLDWYFNHTQDLLGGLNEAMQVYNAKEVVPDQRFQPFVADELNKIAFWNATGSGKTLLLHVNIKQYLHYFQKGVADAYPDKIILLTPNEGLSRQHLDELHLSGFGFQRLFDKNRSGVFKGTIEVIDINKLKDVDGDKTVAVQAFDGNNLVLVDEGHKGTGTADGEWMRRRETLVKGGFAFEYSATFGQAVSKGWNVVKAEDELKKSSAKMLMSKIFGTNKITELNAEQKVVFNTAKAGLILSNQENRKARTLATREIYAKNILFDYSYKYFYEDGYGKDSLILNLKDAAYADQEIAQQYFTACLLSFYQQKFLWHTHRAKLVDFNIENPLWVFVGNTVSGEDSDILSVLKHLAVFLNDEANTKTWIKDLISNTPRLLDSNGNNIFHNRFAALMQPDVNVIYADILQKLFNTQSRQRLKLVNLKASKGELILKVGEAEPFGLINIGDDAGLFKEAESASNQAHFDTESDDFGSSIFNTINNKYSKVNVLIGSRKFTEGWSSWRVSTMGLLNMGQGEGSQIIQLFGRGVRLKGKEYSLKRSTPSQRPKGIHLERLETLNIFGVNAGYMATFKEYLKEEGITPPDEMIQLDFEVKLDLPAHKLKTLALQDGYKDNQIKGFKRTHFPWLYEIPAEFVGKIKTPHVVLDVYPKLEAMVSIGNAAQTDSTVRNSGKIAKETMALFDFERIYLALQSFKHFRSWSNLRLDMPRLKDFCLNSNIWYTLFIPLAGLTINKILDIKKQEDLLIQLLQDYTVAFYESVKNAYEGQFYEVVEVDENHESLLKTYHFDIEDTDDGKSYETKILALQKLITTGKLDEANAWNAGQMVAICFKQHLYYPLFAIEGDAPLKMRPVVFDAPSETRFVLDLQAFYESAIGKEIIGDRSLYLLRNADNKAKGLGFALAGNFYPDFLLWLVDKESGKQWLNFVDPKGLRQMSLSDPKLGLYNEVKVLEEKIGDPNLSLNAFIISATQFSSLLNVSLKQADLEAKNVLFMPEGKDIYLKKMFERICQ